MVNIIIRTNLLIVNNKTYENRTNTSSPYGKTMEAIGL